MTTIISLALFVALLIPANACCPAWRQDGVPVQIADQEVLIVWDKEQGVEHFIRRANFQSDETPNDFAPPSAALKSPSCELLTPTHFFSGYKKTTTTLALNYVNGSPPTSRKTGS